jgi:hypothetical protein
MSLGKYGLLSCAFFPALLYMLLKCRGDNWGNNAGIGIGEDGWDAPHCCLWGNELPDLKTFSYLGIPLVDAFLWVQQTGDCVIHAPHQLFRLYCSSN